MKPDQDRHSALLRRGSLLRIEALPGYRITCLRGMVWLTQEHDSVDRILGAGESFVADRAGVMLINALAHDAMLAYSDPARCTITRSASGASKGALTLAAEIGHIKGRIEPQTLRAMPAGMRRDAVEREVRRMRSQVVWLVVQHVKRIAATLSAMSAVK